MKLFYKSAACSLAPHIVLAELNMVYELEAVDLKMKTCASGDYKMINPNGSVPALRTETGEILSEGAVILQYLADQKPDSGLMPKLGTMERYRALEWLNFIATDLHKNYTPLFFAGMIVKQNEGQSELKNFYVNLLEKKIAVASERLGERQFSLGNNFTVVDAYLFTVLGWSKYVGVDLSGFKNLTNYMSRVGERPSVVRALKEEGMI
jgi:glutathione S-transferase